MSKDLLVCASDHRSIKDLSPGQSFEVMVASGTRLPGIYNVTCGGHARPISCHVTEVTDAKLGRKPKRIRVRVQKK